MKKGFILPLVLLILALMSGIAVVLGRLSSEKTLSLKKQENSYYTKEITVTLVDDTEGGSDSSSGEINLSENITLKKNDTQYASYSEVSSGNYSITVEIEVVDNSQSLSRIEGVTANGSTLEKISNDGNVAVYSGNVTIDSDGDLKVGVSVYNGWGDNNIDVVVDVTLTKN